MKFYAFVRNSYYSKYCKQRENLGEEYDREVFMKEFLETIGTPAIITNLQDYHKEYDMYWCYVEIKEGLAVKLVNSDKYGETL